MTKDPFVVLPMTIKELIKNIKKLKATESDGWDMAHEFDCCPGDDLSDAYNKAIDDVIRLIRAVDKMGLDNKKLSAKIK